MTGIETTILSQCKQWNGSAFPVDNMIDLIKYCFRSNGTQQNTAVDISTEAA